MTPPRLPANDHYKAAAGMGSAIRSMALDLGLDINPICRSLGLDPECFEDVSQRISLDRLCRLLESCAVLTGEPAFGLRATRFFRAGASGAFGYGLLNAPSAMDFFRFLGTFCQLPAEKSQSALIMDSRGAEFQWSYSPLLTRQAQMADMEMGLAIQRLALILGEDIRFVDVGLERASPSRTAPYKAMLSRRIVFNQKRNWLRLPAMLLGRKNPHADNRLFQILERQCTDMIKLQPERSGLIGQLREFLMSRLGDGEVSLSSLAARFHVSERTLQRRLAEIGSSLNELRDDVRKELALILLTDTDLAFNQISARLGYSAPSAFTRSTMRWFGRNPRDIRLHGP